MTPGLLDAKAAKSRLGGRSFALWHLAFRQIWKCCWWCLAAWTPPPLHGWRRVILRAFGAKVDGTARIYGTAQIWYPPNLTMGRYTVLGQRANCYCMAPIRIDDYAVVSQGAVLCAGTHDVDDPDFQLVTKPITIGPYAWVAAEAFVGPGVSVADGAVLGARAVAFRKLDAWTVYSGNPARPIRKRAPFSRQDP